MSSELKEKIKRQIKIGLDSLVLKISEAKEILNLYEKVEQLEETEKAWKKKSLKLQQQNERLREVGKLLLEDAEYVLKELLPPGSYTLNQRVEKMREALKQ